MKLLTLLAVALSLSATAADARHHGSTSAHHRHAQHAMIPIPRERPVIQVRSASTDAPESQGKQGISDVSRDDARQHLTGNPTQAQVFIALYGLQRLASDSFLREVRR